MTTRAKRALDKARKMGLVAAYGRSEREESELLEAMAQVLDAGEPKESVEPEQNKPNTTTPSDGAVGREMAEGREGWRCSLGHRNAYTEATCYLCGNAERRPEAHSIDAAEGEG